MADYMTYLASNVLTEDKVITYRLLSRALKVKVNAAKEMLYDFHRQQNSKKPGTIHATYLLSGTKKPEELEPVDGEIKKDGEDDYMQSSPFIESSIPPTEDHSEATSVFSITLAREEDLEAVRSQYKHISSIHVYSIGPHPLKDLQILSDIFRETQELVKAEDPIGIASTYGTIINKNVKRRTDRRPPPPVAAPIPVPSKSQPVKPKVPEAKPALKKEPSGISSTAKDFFAKGKENSKATATSNPSSKESTPALDTTPTEPATTTNTKSKATLKKESSSLFKSFAKAKPKLKREDTGSSTSAAVEDSPMRDVDDDDDEEDYVVPPPKPKKEANTEIVDKSRKERKEREAALKAMMDMDDSEEEPVPKNPAKEEVGEESKDVEMKDEATEEKPTVVSGGRRRGRRRVMKKKTIQDEEGYLVTKEEPVWESFSEDEPVEQPKPKPQTSAPAAKPKKGAAKAGQGNIMSFFGKK